MVMGFLGVPALTGESSLSAGDLSSVVFSTAVHAFLATAGDGTVLPSVIRVGGVAPGSLAVSVWVSTVIGLQVCFRVCLRCDVWLVGIRCFPALTQNS